jgi:hypothetical protein
VKEVKRTITLLFSTEGKVLAVKVVRPVPNVATLEKE